MLRRQFRNRPLAADRLKRNLGLEIGRKPSACLHTGSSSSSGDPPYAPVSKSGTTSKTLLEVSDLHMSEIGFRCGFTNAEHFSRAFKRQTGQTPTEFRNASRALNPHASRRFMMG
ncbi:helix-turn-helix domain-containing protein [Mesorhizobium sp. INR15]|uniref:helix-turn-helix domain-containing protein n=1 Tax=Mesorhizobium sp. INR15 TaxID=2654248 RepID=UPI0021562DBA|nr:helix-turn-helix domain-containing protein [Mesorhizobium sp. INR15]